MMKRLTPSLWPAYKRLLQRSAKPIILGPYRGEVGFEALYWLPFIRALGISPERLIAVTRGGAHVWYPASRHVELFAIRTPKQVRVENTRCVMRTGMLKQMTVTPFDQAVIRDVAQTLGLKAYHVLHPKWMYHVLEPFWQMRQGYTWLSGHTKPEIHPAIGIEGLTLPQEAVAVRFYARSTFPMNDVCVTVAREAVKRLASKQPVVLLNAGIHADEHVDFDLSGIPNVHRLTDLCQITPENNLAVQSAAIAASVGFVGTYGGLAQLAMLYKKPTVSFYQDWQGTCLAHKHYADTLAISMGVACQVLRVTEIPLLYAAVPPITLTIPQSSSALKQPA